MRWFKASRAIRKVVKSRYVPLVAIGAAFSFLVMMFNVPIPDGTTAHAVGGLLIVGEYLECTRRASKIVH